MRQAFISQHKAVCISWLTPFLCVCNFIKTIGHLLALPIHPVYQLFSMFDVLANWYFHILLWLYFTLHWLPTYIKIWSLESLVFVLVLTSHVVDIVHLTVLVVVVVSWQREIQQLILMQFVNKCLPLFNIHIQESYFFKVS